MFLKIYKICGPHQTQMFRKRRQYFREKSYTHVANIKHLPTLIKCNSCCQYLAKCWQNVARFLPNVIKRWQFVHISFSLVAFFIYLFQNSSFCVLVHVCFLYFIKVLTSIILVLSQKFLFRCLFPGVALQRSRLTVELLAWLPRWTAAVA